MDDNSNSKFEGSLALINTALYVTSAVLMAVCLYYSIFNLEAFTTKTGGSFTFGEKLMFYAFSAMIAGILFSIAVVAPVMKRNKQQRSQMDRRAQNLQKQATTDPLTGMHNRRYFEEALKGYLSEFNKIGAT
ncbi:MAG: GGDEF domain-containing protein, partial [Salaquimonas sp.]